jgi:hypothetical protein
MLFDPVEERHHIWHWNALSEGSSSRTQKEAPKVAQKWAIPAAFRRAISAPFCATASTTVQHFAGRLLIFLAGSRQNGPCLFSKVAIKPSFQIEYIARSLPWSPALQILPVPEQR